MNSQKTTSHFGRFTRSVANAALVGLIISPAAFADGSSGSGDALQTLTQPTSTIEAGVGLTGDHDYKFGEYNGLQNSGVYGIGNVDISGGAPYDSNDTTRWHITGSNLGLENRNISADYEQQGWFKLNFSYDELRRNRSDSFETPYLGAGTNNLTLPSNWLAPKVPASSTSRNDARGLSPDVAVAPVVSGGVATPPSASNLAQSWPIIGADLPDFQHYNLSTKREKFEGGLEYFFTSHWDFKANVTHEDKTGVKPMGTVTQIQGGDISTIIPDVIDQTTDQYNASVTYSADAGYLQVAYYGSIFRNHVHSMSWQDWADPTLTSTMSSAPSNEFHQINFTGGYNFNRTTKLVLDGSYSRATQNDNYLTDVSTEFVPVRSPAALVETSRFGMKFTARPLKDLNVALGYKYDDHHNDTPVYTYAYLDAQNVSTDPVPPEIGAALGLPATFLLGGADLNINANRPYSKTSHNVQANAEYHLTPRNWIRGEYNFELVDRSCPGSWYVDCWDADSSAEHTGRIEWRSNPTDDIQSRVSYTYSSRTVHYNENAFLSLVPMANVVPVSAGATMSAYAALLQSGLTAYGPASGLLPALTGRPQLLANLAIFFPNNNALNEELYVNRNRISELLGMRRYNMADRDRNKVNAMFNWQATEKFSFQAGGDYNHDKYPKSAYGLIKGTNWDANFDGFYQMNEDFNADLYYSHEYHQSNSAGNNYTTNSSSSGGPIVGNGCFATVTDRNPVNKINPCNNWSTDMKDDVDSIGLTMQRKHLLPSGNLDLSGNVNYTWATTNENVMGGIYTNDLLVSGQVDYIPAGPMPAVKTRTLSLRIVGQYTLTKQSAFRFMYGFDHLRSNDYIYEGMQIGSLRGVLPTNEKAPEYNIHSVGVSYIYSF